MDHENKIWDVIYQSKKFGGETWVNLLLYDFGYKKVWQLRYSLNRLLPIGWKHLFWQSADHLPDSPNFLPTKLSSYSYST